VEYCHQKLRLPKLKGVKPATVNSIVTPRCLVLIASSETVVFF
jgi:hypothetical protein